MSNAKKKAETPLVIIQDTREQRPLDFASFGGVVVKVGMVWPGDYTIEGWEHSIAFERKSVSDLIGTLKGGYVGRHSIRRYESRFDLELEEFERHYDRAFVIVEPDPPEVIRRAAVGRPMQTGLEYEDFSGVSAGEQIHYGWYRSAIEPRMVFAFLRALEVEYGCHTYLATSREDAAREIVEISRRYIESRRHVIHRGKVEQEGTGENAAPPKRRPSTRRVSEPDESPF